MYILLHQYRCWISMCHNLGLLTSIKCIHDKQGQGSNLIDMSCMLFHNRYIRSHCIVGQCQCILDKFHRVDMLSYCFNTLCMLYNLYIIRNGLSKLSTNRTDLQQSLHTKDHTLNIRVDTSMNKNQEGNITDRMILCQNISDNSEQYLKPDPNNIQPHIECNMLMTCNSLVDTQWCDMSNLPYKLLMADSIPLHKRMTHLLLMNASLCHIKGNLFYLSSYNQCIHHQHITCITQVLEAHFQDRVLLLDILMQCNISLSLNHKNSNFLHITSRYLLNKILSL